MANDTRDMDPGDKCMRTKQPQKEYTPKPYHRRDRHGLTLHATKKTEAIEDMATNFSCFFIKASLFKNTDIEPP